MAQWYHLFSLLSVMCMSFGALYIVFNSDFNQVCDYSDTVDSCDERKTYKPTEVEWEKKQLGVDWLAQAQELRNQTEKMKCDTERDLLKDLQDLEKAEAQRVVAKCLTDFRACVTAGYSTTTPGPVQTDCTACNRFCATTNWANIDRDYAAAMGFTGVCSNTVCPWLPECGLGMHVHRWCSMRGCPCNMNQCTTTTKTTTMNQPATVTVTTVTVTTVTTTAGSTTTSTSTTSTGSTTTATTSTSTSTTTLTTTSTTTTSTTTTSTSTTSTTTTTTTITTVTLPPVTTTVTSTTQTTTIGCFCNAGVVDTVIVGRPYKTFYQPQAHSWSSQTVKLMQGVTITSTQRLPLGGMLTHDCRTYFSQRSNYFGPQQHTDPIARNEAENNHYDLGCGYSGQFNIKCGQNAAQMAAGTCGAQVDISTCNPPTYSQALDACYTPPTTTTRMSGPTLPTVPDWLGVEDLNFSLAQLPPFYNITTQTTTPYPCCEVHVGSVCRPDVNFDHPFVGTTVDGRWMPAPAYNRTVGYFPVVSCDKQAESTPRQCPRVKIKQVSAAYQQWPHCLSACNTAKAQADFEQICNRTANPIIEQKEKAAHQAKIDLMKAKSAELEAWTASKMSTVTETKQVIDCFDDRLPRRYNSMALPKMRSGFSTMPLHNQCRLHSCQVTQCLEVRKPCKIPFVHDPPEIMCNIYRSPGTFSCVDKVDIMSNNPLSLGFGIVWMVVGAVFCCFGIASYVRLKNPEGGSQSERETTALAPI